MKSTFLPFCLAALCTLFTSQAVAQHETVEGPKERPKGAVLGFLGGMRIDEVGLNLGSNTDRYQSMDVDYMRHYTNRTSLTDIDLSGFDSDEALALSVFGTNIGVELVLSPLRMTRQSNLSQQLRVGFDFVVHREAMVTYTNWATSDALTYCIIQNEAMLNVSYIFRTNHMGNFSLFFGAGTTLGKTFGNRFIFINDSDVTYPDEERNFFGNTTDIRGRSSQFGRLYVPFGFDVAIAKTVRLGLEGRYGIGFENVAGHATHFIRDNVNVQMNLNFILPAAR